MSLPFSSGLPTEIAVNDKMVRIVLFEIANQVDIRQEAFGAAVRLSEPQVHPSMAPIGQVARTAYKVFGTQQNKPQACILFRVDCPDPQLCVFTASTEKICTVVHNTTLHSAARNQPEN